MLVGCQSQSTQSLVVDSMPAPSFSGPVMQDDIRPVRMAALPVPAGQSVRTVAATPRILVPTPAPHQKGHEAIPTAWMPGIKANSWKWIVIHHSATPTGGAAAFDKMHKAKGWDELGYHFVVGNGTDTHDGQIEVGGRWVKQKWGAHTKTPDNQFNEHGIGICLVGNFDVSHPSDGQLKSLARLVSFLMKTYHIPADHVLGHRDCKSTDCPGKYMSLAKVRQLSVQMLADAGDTIPPEASATLARGEMLHDEKQGGTR
jgi:hypothetical protein